LQGAPGIYSARFAGKHGDDAANNAKLLLELEQHQDRSARFQCALAFLRFDNDPNPIISQASWHGEILTTNRGQNGFGYDPLFYIPDLKKTSAELETAHKKSISHRALALANLKGKLALEL